MIRLLQFWNLYIGYLCILKIELKILLYVFKSINNLAPSYLSDQLYPYNPTRNLRSGDQRLLSVPRSWLKHRRDRAFAVAGPMLWNSHPAYIRLAQSLTVFKLSLTFTFYIYAFSRRFYPKRLTLHSSYSFYILSALAFPGNRTHDLGVANAMLYQLS